MRIAKGLSLSAAAVALLLGGAAQADQQAGLPGQQADAGPSVGIGVICNTSDQAEQYVGLRAKGQAIRPAMNTVNAKAKQPRACGIAAIAFIRDRTLDTKAVNGKLVQIVRINVIAGYNGRSWHHVADTVQYAVIAAKGIAI